MLKITAFVLLFFTVSSCDKKHELIIKNNSDKNVYLISSELKEDSIMTNRWLYEYSQEYNYVLADSYYNIRDEIGPKCYQITRYYPDDRFKNYKLYLYFIRFDSLLLLKKKDLDSTLISRFLLKKCVLTAEDIFKQKKLEVCYP